MKRIHPATTFATLFNFVAIISLVSGFPLISSLLSVLAFFAAMKEVPKYTSWYQFLNVLAAALIVGFSIDLPNEHFPLTAFSLLLMACVAIVRILFFRTFSYTSYSWFEPVTLVISFLVYLTSNFIFHHDWRGYLIPLPILIFDAVFTWGTIKDKNQLLKNSRGGYRVHVGKEANEFELPDQDGNTVKLSDFKNQRHVLLIFVRGDWCPGCHMMLRAYEKNNDKFKAQNVLVMAIGPDPVGVNRGMVEKLGLDFKVLSDEGQRTAMTYGVQLKEYDNDFAEKYEEGIPLPASFLIDKDSVVRYVSRPDKVGEFLNPSLIFPIVDQLDKQHKNGVNGNSENAFENKEVTKENTIIKGDSIKYERIIADLKKELNNYESIINQANDAMLVIDIVDGKIHQTNPSAATLLGYNENELTQLSLFDLHPKEYLDKSSRVVADVWEKGGLIYTDIPFLTKTNGLISVECSAKVAPFAGRPAIVIYARDIRERLKMEEEINEQRKLIDEKSKDIQDSIAYSKRIQRSIFIEQEKLKDHAPDSFILFKPRDIVSGDFYWFTNYVIKRDFQSPSGNNYVAGTDILLVAAADCTGHGVPGAFMSIIGNTLLSQTITDSTINSPASALDYVNAELKKSLNKNKEDTPLRDGMDIALCCIDRKGMILEYAGANNPVYVIRDKEIIVLKADKQPITAYRDSESKPFSNQRIDLKEGDNIYLFTDGFADQFGGESAKKFMYKRFKETLMEIQKYPMEKQGELLEKTFEDWRGNQAQVDDVLVIGIKI
jgi:PAS domain S-box-containing protein